MENCLVAVGLDLWFKLIQTDKEEAETISGSKAFQRTTMRKEAEFEVVSGCAEGFVSKTMAVSCEWCLRRDIEVWIDGNQTV